MQRFILVPILGIAALAASAPARAQSDWLGRAPVSYAEQRSSYYDARQAAYDNGYREGLKEGQKDGRRNETFRYQDEKTWQRADKGYHREFGDLSRYRQSFRSGYADGYGAAYQRSGAVYDRGRYGDERYGSRDGRYGDSRGVYGDGRYGDPRVGSGNGRYPGYPQGYPNGSRAYGGVAFQNGADDGFEKGQEDARKGRSFDPLRHAWYRAGDRRYESRSGSRDEYRDIYRRGFQEGYDRGYREGRYR